MQQKIKRRETIMLDGTDVTVRGTYHKTDDDSFDARSKLIEHDRIGILFLNGLYATRAGNGDSAVYWADSFAERGYPSFRLDLPAYGDSGGDPPTEWLDYINQGGYTSTTSAMVKELVAKFNLSGVVIVGHCAGAVSAIYAAAASKECKGLVLMDPYFYVPRTARPRLRQQLNTWALQSRFGSFLSSIFDRLKELRMSFQSNALPDNANHLLLRCWKEVASAGLPILILKAPGWKTSGAAPRVGEFDYFKYALELAGRKSQVVIEITEGANHSFANHLGREAVLQHTERWLDTCFPLTRPEENVSDLCSERNDNKIKSELYPNCLPG